MALAFMSSLYLSHKIIEPKINLPRDHSLPRNSDPPLMCEITVTSYINFLLFCLCFSTKYEAMEAYYNSLFRTFWLA